MPPNRRDVTWAHRPLRLTPAVATMAEPRVLAVSQHGGAMWSFGASILLADSTMLRDCSAEVSVCAAHFLGMRAPVRVRCRINGSACATSASAASQGCVCCAWGVWALCGGRVGRPSHTFLGVCLPCTGGRRAVPRLWQHDALKWLGPQGQQGNECKCVQQLALFWLWRGGLLVARTSRPLAKSSGVQGLSYSVLRGAGRRHLHTRPSLPGGPRQMRFAPACRGGPAR